MVKVANRTKEHWKLIENPLLKFLVTVLTTTAVDQSSNETDIDLSSNSTHLSTIFYSEPFALPSANATAVSNASTTPDPAGDATEAYSIEMTLFIIVAGTLLSVVTAGGNLLVILSFKLDKQLQTISNYFLFSLAVADLTIGTISIPLMTYYTALQQWKLGYTACQFWLSVDYLMSNASVCNLLLISFDRYFSLTKPLTYRPRRTTRKAILMIASTFVVSAVLWPPWIIAWPYIEGDFAVLPNECIVQFLKTNPYVTIGTAILAFYLPVTIMVFLYSKVYFVTRTRHKAFESLAPAKKQLPKAKEAEENEAKKVCNGKAGIYSMKWTTTANCGGDNFRNGLKSQSTPRPFIVDSEKSEINRLSERAPYRQIGDVSSMMMDGVGADSRERPNSAPIVACSGGVVENPWTIRPIFDYFGRRRSPPSKVSKQCSVASTSAEFDDISSASSCYSKDDTSTQSHVLPSYKLQISPIVPCKNARMLKADKRSKSFRLDMKPSAEEMYLKVLSGTTNIRRHSASNCSASDGADKKNDASVFSVVIQMPCCTRPTVSVSSTTTTSRQHPRSLLHSDKSTKSLITEASKPMVIGKMFPFLVGPKRNPRAVHRRSSSRAQQSKTMEKRQERKAARTLSAILLAFIVTWTPYNLIVCIETLLPNTVPPVWFTFSYYLCYINSTVNPICYALCNAIFRKNFLKIITCDWLRRRRARKHSNEVSSGNR